VKEERMEFLGVSVLLGLLGAAACSSGSGSAGGVQSTTVTGTIAGATVPTTSDYAVIGPLVDTFGPFTSDGVAVTISNIANSCSVAQHNGSPANMTSLVILVAAPIPVVPGTYAITTTTPTATSTIGYLVYETTNAQCSRTTIHSAHSGSITLLTVGSTSVEGTFSVTMDTGDHVLGTFTAPVCDLSGVSDSSTSSECGS